MQIDEATKYLERQFSQRLLSIHINSRAFARVADKLDRKIQGSFLVFKSAESLEDELQRIRANSVIGEMAAALNGADNHFGGMYKEISSLIGAYNGKGAKEFIREFIVDKERQYNSFLSRNWPLIVAPATIALSAIISWIIPSNAKQPKPQLPSTPAPIRQVVNDKNDQSHLLSEADMQAVQAKLRNSTYDEFLASQQTSELKR